MIRINKFYIFLIAFSACVSVATSFLLKSFSEKTYLSSSSNVFYAVDVRQFGDLTINVRESKFPGYDGAYSIDVSIDSSSFLSHNSISSDILFSDLKPDLEFLGDGYSNKNPYFIRYDAVRYDSKNNDIKLSFSPLSTPDYVCFLSFSEDKKDSFLSCKNKSIAY